MALKLYPNGLRLSVVQKEDAKLMSAVLHITSGTQSEKNFESGISEFVSRMLLMGTNRHPKNRDLMEFAKNNGILLSSDNTSESIIVSATTVAGNFDKAIDLLTEIAFESNFDISSGDAVRNGLLADIAKLQENPSYVLERMVNQSLFYRTGLANPKYGTNTTISRMTAGDAKEFLERVLTPKNTVISVVGNVDPQEVYEKVMQTFYTRFIEGGEYKKLKYVAEIDDFVGGERTKNKKLNQSRMFISFPSLSYKSVRKYAIDIISPIIERKINESFKNAKYFHRAKVSHETFANNGKLTIETMVDYEHVNEYLAQVVDVIKSLAKDGLYEYEFENEKNAFVIKFLESNETVRDLALASAHEVAITKQSYSLASELMKVELIKVSDANKLLSYIFDTRKMYVAYLGNPIELNTVSYID